MPRQRMVKPEFFDSDSLAECSIPARLTFIGLWVMCDDYGNVKASLGKLKRNIYPCDDMDLAEFAGYLIELERVGCIKGYERDGERYINVPNFNVYQTVKMPSKTRCPEPKEDVARKHRTDVLRMWASGTQTMGDKRDTDPVLTQYLPTTDHINKEGSTTYFLNKGNGGTGSPVAAPPSQKGNERFSETIEGAASCIGFIRGGA